MKLNKLIFPQPPSSYRRQDHAGELIYVPRVAARDRGGEGGEDDSTPPKSLRPAAATTKSSILNPKMGKKTQQSGDEEAGGGQGPGLVGGESARHHDHLLLSKTNIPCLFLKAPLEK